MPVQPNAFGFTANLHGGAIATMVDVACAMAAARFSGFDPFKESLVTADMHVRYLGRAKTEMVVAGPRSCEDGS
ncbi:MAG: PaaI family thioesterase [Acidimicrobiales bacterium]